MSFAFSSLSSGIGYALILDRSSLQKYLTGTCGAFFTFVYACSSQSYFFIFYLLIYFFHNDIEAAQRATETEE